MAKHRTPADIRRSVLAAKAQAFDQIADLLWPTDNPQQEWDGSTIENVGAAVLTVYPRADAGDRTTRPSIGKLRAGMPS
jgi:hypothetical protein